MAEITFRLQGDVLSAAVTQVLARIDSSLHPNPLVRLIAAAIQAEADSIGTRVRNITQEFVASDEFAKRIKAVYRDALLGEAARMGRNAARAMVNAQEVDRG